MALLAIPYNPLVKLGTEAANSTMLNGMAAMFPLPGTPEQRKILAAQIIADQRNRCWQVWHGAEMVGVLLLTDIVAGLDAKAHFVFFDHQLAGRRNLIWNMIGAVFRDSSLNLNRLTIEIPEHLPKLIKFVRKVLSFKIEGEGWAAAHPLGQQVAVAVKPYVQNPAQWLARVGARKEQAFWRSDTQEWVDLILLRLLRSEYEVLRGQRLSESARPS